jgi:hypothetical protein
VGSFRSRNEKIESGVAFTSRGKNIAVNDFFVDCGTVILHGKHASVTTCSGREFTFQGAGLETLASQKNADDKELTAAARFSDWDHR